MNRIINFHDVRDIAWFERIIKLLINKYNMISAQDLELYYYDKKKLRNSCHLTVDDGDISFYDVIYPIIKKYNIPVSLFVSPAAAVEQKNFWFQEILDYDKEKLKGITASFLGVKIETVNNYPVHHILKLLKISEIWEIIKMYRARFNIEPKRCRNMGTKQLTELDREGLVALGAHTLTHPILLNENDIDAEYEIVRSINKLSEITGSKIKYFAYPNGVPGLDFGKREIDILQKSGIKLAFSTESDNINSDNDPLSIPRFEISYGSEQFVRMKLFLGSSWDIFKSIRKKSEKKTRAELRDIINSVTGNYA